MYALWTLVVGVGIFMMFFTITEMPTTTINGILTTVWFAVAVLAGVEGTIEYRRSTRRPDPNQEFREYHRKVRRANAKRRRQPRF